MTVSTMGSRLVGIVLATVFALGLLGSVAQAAEPITRDLPPGLQIPTAAMPGPGFDIDKATEAYLNLLSPEQRALSDAYFEGGYWLQLWSLLWTIGACALLLITGAS
jgi:STE24 endopeptidase